MSKPDNPGTPHTPPGKTPGSITIDPTSVSIVVGASQQITATVRNVHGGVLSGVVPSSYTTTGDAISVDASGLVLGIAVGSAAIRAVLGPLLSNPCNVMVTDIVAPIPPVPPDTAPASIDVTPMAVTLTAP